jgi:myo-inositol 2-dehydrogenase / D-chiro-inositol 1-dehydrogenase
MIRLAVIGAGSHSALHHGSALMLYRQAHAGEIELAAVCDLDRARAEAYARKFGFAAVYTDYVKMFGSERLDGVVAVTPIARTAEIAADLLRRGLPLALEKPPGRSSAETLGLLAAAEKSGTPHMVSFNRRYIPAVVKAREWLAGPGAGRRPLQMTARILRRARRETDFVVGTAIHVIDAVLSFLGAPDAAFTVKTPTAHDGRFLSHAVLRFHDGACAAVEIAPDVGVEEETFEIRGQDYRIRIDSAGCSLRVHDAGREVLAWEAPEGSEPAFVMGSLGETEAFVRAIRTGRGYWPDLRDGLVSMRTAEAVEAGGERAVGGGR